MSGLTSKGNPAGRFPPEMHDALDAVFDEAKPLNPGEVLWVDTGGTTRAVPRPDALVWKLGELDAHWQLHLLTATDQVPSQLQVKFHAIEAAADDLLKKLGALEDAARFGVPDQIREGLQHFADLEATESPGVVFETIRPRLSA